jgi:hypothetical protein
MSVLPAGLDPVVFEHATRVAPLGVRFYDPLIGRYVDQLIVTVRANRRPQSGLLLLKPNRSAVYVLQNVPGLRDFEFGAGDAGFWAEFESGIPARSPYTLAVYDPLRRYLPFSLQVAVPAHGLVEWSCEPLASPVEANAAGIPLFSTPQRPAPQPIQTMAVVRAGLYDPLADQPAAWAVLELSYEGRVLGRGIADERGQVVVFLPYPPPAGFLPLSPMTPTPPAGEPVWTVAVRVGWLPTSPPAQAATDAPGPDLCEILRQLDGPPAHAWADATRTRLLTEASLRLGQELILRTASASPPDGPALSQLLVTPAVSPP